MTQIAVADTNALIWYAEERWNRLGSSARAFFHEVDAGKAAVYIPALVIVELLEADRKGVIRLKSGAADWVGALLTGGSFFEAPLNAAIVLKAQALIESPNVVTA